MTNETLRMQMLSGIITEGEYKAIIDKKIEEEEKASLNESMIGGIVGVGAINQIPPRAKADYEMAFEHFLGERYETKFENREQDPYTMEENEEVTENNTMAAYQIAQDLIADMDLPDEVITNEGLFLDVIKALKDKLYEKAADLFATKAGSSPDEYSMEEGKEVEEPTNY
jgi:hypothetical protein